MHGNNVEQRTPNALISIKTMTGGQHGFPPEEMSKLWPQIFKWLSKRKIGL